MKFRTNRTDLTRLVSRAAGTTTDKSTVQILSHVLLEAFDDTLTVSATDTDQSFRGSIPVTLEAPGRVTVSAATLMSILPPLDSDDIVVTTDHRNYVILKGTDSRKREFTLYGGDPASFPQIPAFVSDNTFVISQSELNTAINKTAFCTSHDNLRFYLQGVQILKTEGAPLKFTATDSRRLAFYSSVTEAPEMSVIVPGRAMREVQRMLGESGDVEINITDKRAMFKIDGMELSTFLIDGRFPDTEKVKVTQFTTTVCLQGMELLDAVAAVAKIVDKDSPRVNMEFTHEGVNISVANSNKGQAAIHVPIDSLEGPPITICVNHKYIKEALDHTPDGGIMIGMNNVKDAVTIKPLDTEDYSYIVMPIRDAG